jgi:hypothetical protein
VVRDDGGRPPRVSPNPLDRCGTGHLEEFDMSRTAALVLACFVMLSGGLLAQAESVGQVRIGGIRLQYVDWGGSGAALVLVPGGCDTAFVFGDLRLASLVTFTCCR